MIPSAWFLSFLLLPLVQAGFDFHAAGTLFRRSPNNIHRRSRIVRDLLPRKSFTIADKYEGDNFFELFQFNTFADPTNGYVNYISQSAAQGAGLAVLKGGAAVMAVDSTTKLQVGTNRNSVRVTSNAAYTHALVIADIAHMPTGCSTWPAFWLVGPNWPNQGEIDIIENVNNAATNQMTLHTSAGCTLTTAPGNTTSSLTGAIQAFTGDVLVTECESSDSSNLGCSFKDPSTQSFGDGFNNIGGGVYATLWDTTGIYIWFFSRSSIPEDIDQQAPNPSSWGTPVSFWSSDSCDMDSHFSDMSIVFDITLCGDWAGATYSSSGCSGTCAGAVADPSTFKDAFWEVNYVHVYQ